MDIDDSLPQADDAILVAAFEGWNDAADAASAAARHLIDVFSAQRIAQVDDETYYDFQLNRPIVGRTFDAPLALDWPTTELYYAQPPEWPTALIVAIGSEPNLKWRSFCGALLDVAEEIGVNTVATLGAMLTDTPHSRPIPISGLTSPQDIAVSINLEPADYVGPAGINAVLAEQSADRGLTTLMLWSGVPHYLAEPPCPKATLALVQRLEDALGASIPTGDLPELVDAWQRGAEAAVEEDPTLAEYVAELEQSNDITAFPGASAEDIARDFERFLRRRDDDA